LKIFATVVWHHINSNLKLSLKFERTLPRQYKLIEQTKYHPVISFILEF